ncbi:MAG: hypothetical protein AMJ95_04885 [Omnitrophica WOR_2 bacterium SM23_72]|nr:MAG: hypothetical protein AMJ95_04885 [Omnitrophica WOR_2 bacterium SM23_72]
MKIKRRFFLLALVLVLILSAVIVYLNRVILPTQIKSLLVHSLQEKTGKDVSLSSLQFNIFKGLVLRDLLVYDEKTQFIHLKEGSCTFLILPLLKKKLVIRNLNLRSPEVLLERKSYNTFNLQGLLLALAGPKEAKAGWKVLILNVNIRNASVHFQDNTSTPAFTRDILHLDARAELALPACVRFDLSAQVLTSTDKPMHLQADGEFKIPEQTLISKIRFQDFSPKEFTNYYKDLGILILEGKASGLIDMEYKEDTLYADLEARGEGLSIAKENISARVSSDIKMSLLYNFHEKRMAYSGKAKILEGRLQGLNVIDSLEHINADVVFSDSEVSTDNLKADVWGIPLEAKAALQDLRKPLLHLSASSRLNLESISVLLKDKFNFSFFEDLKGLGILSFSLSTRLKPVEDLQLSGSLDILNAELKLKKPDIPLEAIKGRLEFSQNQAKAPGLDFKLTLSSNSLSLESVFTYDQKLVNLSQCAGQYLHSDFSFRGLVDTKDSASWQSSIKGDLDIDLEDLKLEQVRPQGSLKGSFSLQGPIRDIKSCAIKADLSSPALSAYGLKGNQFQVTYVQENGLGLIPLLQFSSYDGMVEANGSINYREQDYPFGAAVNIQGIKIEQLKQDTEVRDKDIAGKVNARMKLRGISSDLSRLSGEGNILVTDGKLWQLNLFQGLGALLFAKKDFSNIIFEQGTCDFIIRDKFLLTDNLLLKSKTTDLSGSAKIGFDNSIDVSLRVHVLDDQVPLSGTFKDITTSIVGEGGLFGVIKISGTLKEPKYRFQTAVINILKGLTDKILGR